MTKHDKATLRHNSIILSHYTILKAVANTINLDLERMLTKDVKMEFGRANRALKSYFAVIEPFIEKNVIEECDEKSFGILDLMQIINAKENQDKAMTMINMLTEYSRGTCKILDNEGNAAQEPYAYEFEGRLYYPHQITGLTFSEDSKPKPLYSIA